METQSDTSEHEVGGNTVKSPTRVSRGREWLFTLNNYTDDEVMNLKTQLDKLCVKYRMQSEVGTEGTPHIQGCIKFTNARNLSALKKINNRCHWEIVICSEAAYDYCAKSKTADGKYSFSKGIPMKIEDPMLGLVWKPWQLELHEIMKGKPDKRTVHWYWDEKGGCGKTTLCRYFKWLYPSTVLCVAGKGNDIKYAVKAFNEIEGNDLKTVIFTFSRSLEDCISYEAIENIKDGLFFCGKYESSDCLINQPHVICFANFKPKMNKLSVDRWKIVCLDEKNDDDF